MIEIGGHAPQIAEISWTAPGGVVAGRLSIGPDSAQRRLWAHGRART